MPCSQQVGPGELSQPIAPDQKPVPALRVGAMRVRWSPRADTLCPRRGSHQQPSSLGPLCGPSPSWGWNTYTCVDFRARAASVRPGGPALPCSLRHRNTCGASRTGLPGSLCRESSRSPPPWGHIPGGMCVPHSCRSPGACWGLRGASRGWGRLGGAGSSRGEAAVRGESGLREPAGHGRAPGGCLRNHTAPPHCSVSQCFRPLAFPVFELRLHIS